MARAKKNSEVVQETESKVDDVTSNPEYDLYKTYQDYFEAQQKQVLEYWTTVLNNVFWWTKK